MPELAKLRAQVGSVKGQSVLLLGNGASDKELAFLLDEPSVLVYSDLSTNASRALLERVDVHPYRAQMRFAGVDAQHMPFDDGSFDVVYAFAMVHHLPALNRFLAEAYRVLKPNGRAVFFDDGYAPIWHWSKRTWLRPLMKCSHARSGISPEDLRFSESGGFRERQLREEIQKVGGVPWFERASLVSYVFYRGAEKLLPLRVGSALRGRWLGGCLSRIDQLIGRMPVLRKNQIRLLWGFQKPDPLAPERLTATSDA